MLEKNSFHIPIPEHVLRVAEDLNTYLPLATGDQRHIKDEFVLWMGPTSDPHHNVVQRLRIAPGGLSAVVEQAREIFRRNNRHQATWEVGNSATPENLNEELTKLGMVADDPDPISTGMVLAQTLTPQVSSTIVAKRVETLEEYRACCEIVQACFGSPADDNVQEQFNIFKADPQKTRWIALRNNIPVAMADATHLEYATILNGAATIPEARGQGAYRALLAARSLEAQRRGAPMLVTQAGSMSRPILKSLGFEEKTQVHIFVDTF
jgi:hypothetical protein